MPHHRTNGRSKKYRPGTIIQRAKYDYDTPSGLMQLEKYFFFDDFWYTSSVLKVNLPLFLNDTKKERNQVKHALLYCPRMCSRDFNGYHIHFHHKNCTSCSSWIDPVLMRGFELHRVGCAALCNPCNTPKAYKEKGWFWHGGVLYKKYGNVELECVLPNTSISYDRKHYTETISLNFHITFKNGDHGSVEQQIKEGIRHAADGINNNNFDLMWNLCHEDVLNDRSATGFGWVRVDTDDTPPDHMEELLSYYP